MTEDGARLTWEEGMDRIRLRGGRIHALRDEKQKLAPTIDTVLITKPKN